MTTKTREKTEPKVTILKFSVLIIVDKDPPGYHSYAPSLKGLHMGGKTEKEARDSAKEAAVLYLKSLLKHGDHIPIDVMDQSPEDEKTTGKKHSSLRIEEIQVKL